VNHVERRAHPRAALACKEFFLKRMQKPSYWHPKGKARPLGQNAAEAD